MTQYYTGTKAQCEAYNQSVIDKENFDEIATTDWCEPIECVGYWAVIANEKYPSNLETVNSIKVKFNEI